MSEHMLLLRLATRGNQRVSGIRRVWPRQPDPEQPVFGKPDGGPRGSRSTIPVGPLGLTTFRTLTTPARCRLRLSAGSAVSARDQHVSDPTGLRTFWFLPVSPFGTLDMTTVKRRFTWVSRASHPWLPTALGLAVATEPRGVVTRPRTEATLSQALRTPGLPPTHGPIGD